MVRRPRHARGPPPLARRTTPTSCRTTRRARTTSSSSSRGVGASSRASPTAATTTSRSTPRHSGERLEYFDQATNERYVPHVIEPAAGRHAVDDGVPAGGLRRGGGRAASSARCCGCTTAWRRTRSRCSRCRRTSGSSPTAREVLKLLQPHFMTDYDETQAIGRRYRRQDEIGTPFAVTVDFESIDDKAVTVRERDSMDQERVPIGQPGRPPARPPAADGHCHSHEGRAQRRLGEGPRHRRVRRDDDRLHRCRRRPRHAGGLHERVDVPGRVLGPGGAAGRRRRPPRAVLRHARPRRSPACRAGPDCSRTGCGTRTCR